MVDLHVVVVHLDGRVGPGPCEPHHMVRVVHHLHTDLSYRVIVGAHVVHHVHVPVNLSEIQSVNIQTSKHLTSSKVLKTREPRRR